MTTYTYRFEVGYTKLGVATAPSVAPTINVVDVDADTLLVTAGVTTASTSMPGVYSYSYTGALGLNLTGLFHTTDTSVDQQDLFSIDINLSSEAAAVVAVASTAVNSYITRGGFINWLASQTATATVDDMVIDDIIEQTSRIIDDITGRRFYPFRQTNKYDIPDDGDLELNDDLLEVYTLTNGDGVVIASSDYNLYSVNSPPYWRIRLKDISTVSWEPDSSGSDEQVVTLDGLWSYRPQYSTMGWTQVGTLGAAITDTTGLTITLTAGHTAVTGQIWKIGSEFVQGSVATNTLTVIQRGDNGSTAATHLNGVAMYAWNVYKPIQNVAYQIATGVYKRRFGENVSGVARVTGAGVVITPTDIPQLAMRTLISLSRLS